MSPDKSALAASRFSKLAFQASHFPGELSVRGPRQASTETDCIHSLLNIGPEFKVTAQIDASLEVSDLEATVGLNYNLSGVTFAFPPNNWQAGSFTPGTSREYPACLFFGPHLMSRR